MPSRVAACRLGCDLTAAAMLLQWRMQLCHTAQYSMSSASQLTDAFGTAPPMPPPSARLRAGGLELPGAVQVGVAGPLDKELAAGPGVARVGGCVGRVPGGRGQRQVGTVSRGPAVQAGGHAGRVPVGVC